MDGLLVIDKPAGPTSHDVVARMRRVLRQPRIGHTGTLDPSATGVLPLVLGRATRLAKFLSASDKSYEAVIRLGVATDTYDAAGREVGERYRGPLPSQEAIDRALDAFRGAFLQQPPAFSAKKIAGKRSHRLARDTAPAPAASPALPAAVAVTAHRIDVMSVHENAVALVVECSAGFYVRSLAHDLGVRLGVGAHLAALRRTRSGDLTLGDAVALLAVEGDHGVARRAMVPLDQMLPSLVAVVLTAEGARHALHGRMLGAADVAGGGSVLSEQCRLMDQGGRLIGIGQPAGNGSALLHPSIVLV